MSVMINHEIKIYFSLWKIIFSYCSPGCVCVCNADLIVIWNHYVLIIRSSSICNNLPLHYGTLHIFTSTDFDYFEDNILIRRLMH